MSTYKRDGDVFKLTAYGGYEANGTQRKKKKTWKPSPELLRNKAKLEKELKRQLVELQELCDSDTLAAGRIRFGSFVDLWRERYAIKNLKPTSIEFYDRALLRILPVIGNIKLEDLNRRHIDNLYRDLEDEGTKQNIKYVFVSDFKTYLKEHHLTRSRLAEQAGVSMGTLARLGKGQNINRISYERLIEHIDKEFFRAVNEGEMLSPNTLHHYHKVLNALLKKAVKWGYLNENLCEKVEPIRAQDEQAPYLDDEQIQLLFSLLEDEPEKYRVMIKLLVYSGLRRGEVKGLQWNDIDFENNVLYVRRELLYLPEKGVYIENGKTKSSVRDFSLPQEIFDLLKKYKISQTKERLMLGDRWIDSGYVFTGRDGQYMHPNTITGWFREFIERHGLSEQWKGVHVHSLRHSNASLLIAYGVPLPVIADRLGHANPTITARVYSHAFKSSDSKAADVLAAVLNTQEGEKENHA